MIIAPIDFTDFTVSENVYAGNAMNRRLFFQYGLLLPANPSLESQIADGTAKVQGDVSLLKTLA